jgi:hypothetical protein
MPTYKKCKMCDSIISIKGILCDECLVDGSVTMTLDRAIYIFKLKFHDLYYSTLTVIETGFGMSHETYYLIDELIDLADKKTKNYDPGHKKREYFIQQKEKYQKLKQVREEKLWRKRSIMDNVEAALKKYDAPFKLDSDNYGIKLIINKYINNEHMSSMEATYGIIGEVEQILNKKKHNDNYKQIGMLTSLFE